MKIIELSRRFGASMDFLIVGGTRLLGVVIVGEE